MRRTLVKTLVEYADDSRFVFLTGDLGYKALEPLQEKMQERFINAGIAEQNMVTVAAGLAAAGSRPWCYSIAPFLYARAFEQIRNDCAQANLPVMLVGNGAGYAYGVMGPSHHALNDYGVLLTLPNMQCYMPAFAQDVAPIVQKMFTSDKPCYLRLGVAEEPKDFEYSKPYTAWRNIFPWRYTDGPIVIIVGSIAGGLVASLLSVECTVWVVTELPSTAPVEFYKQMTPRRAVLIIEEHVCHGSFGNVYSSVVMSDSNLRYGHYVHRYAKGYPSGLSGSKEYHRKESGLDKDSIVELVKRMT